MLEKEQETNECTGTLQGLTEILEGKRGSFKKRRRRTNEKQGKINGITVPSSKNDAGVAFRELEEAGGKDGW